MITTKGEMQMMNQSEEEKKEGEEEGNEEEKDEDEEEIEEESEESEEEEYVRSTTVFEEISRVLSAILRNGHSQNVKVKHLCIYQMLPKLVNMTIPFLKSEHSEAFLKMMLRASRIKWVANRKKRAAAAEKHIMPYINLNKDFLKTGGLVLNEDIEKLGSFPEMLKSFKTGYTHTTEQLKREAIKTIFLYLQEFNRQVIQKMQGDNQSDTDHKRYKALCKTNFLPIITTDMLPLLKDYYDSIREEACIVTEFIITHFLPHEPSLDKESSDLIMMLRGNLAIGWNANMSTPLK